MRVLVTGVAGCLGSHIADSLIERGHEVFGLDNLLTGRIENVHPEVDFWEGDITLVGGSEQDVIVHCAASYDDPTNWSRDAETNAYGTAIVCEEAQRQGCRVVYLQTALCYGHNPDMTGGPIRLGTPINPDNSYAISKTAGESYLIHSGLDYVSLRLANIYGPRNLSGPIPTFYKRLMEGKPCKVSDARRDFLHVEDFLGVAIPAIEGKGSGVYHVSSGTDIPILDAYRAVADALGIESEPELLPRQDGDAPSILLDPSETERVFTWKAEVDFRTGVQGAVNWYKHNSFDRTFTHLRQD